MPPNKGPRPRVKPRLKDRLVEAYFNYLENERNASEHTLTAYRRALDGFRDAQPGAPGWTECTTDPFRDYLFDLMKRGQARAYVRLQFAALRSFYKYLCQRRGLAINPLKALHLPKAEKKLPQPLTAAQIDELLAAPRRVEREAQAPVWMPARDVAVLRTSTRTRRRCGCSARGARSGSARWVRPRWRPFRATAWRRECTPGRCSSPSCAPGWRRAPSGS